jgi:hypothetical protein
LLRLGSWICEREGVNMKEPEFARLIERICDEHTLRRQFLWLHARETGDLATAEALEAVEPTLRRRMVALQAEFIARGGRLGTPAEQRAGFARMQDELLELCARKLV